VSGSLLAATGDAIVRLTQTEPGWRAETLLDEPGLQCLAAADGRIVAGSRGHGVWVSEDGGESWNDAKLPQPDVFSVAISRADGAIYAGCEPSMLFRRADDSWEELRTLRELPSAPTWSFPPRPWTSHVRWIAPSPHEASLLLVGIELGGLMRSEDGGETWEDHRPGAQRDVHSLAWHPSVAGRAYEAGGGGSAWSFDGGRTWQPADQGRDRHYTWAVTPDPADPDCWYVSASPGPFHAHREGRAEAYVYRWRGEGPWQQLDGGLPQPLDAMPYALVATRGELYAGLSDGRVYASSDGGDSWVVISFSGDSLSRIFALAATELA
jgi:BNR/Asp-box repeat protein